MKRLAFLVAVLAASPALAVTPALRLNGMQLPGLASSPCSGSTNCLYFDTSNVLNILAASGAPVLTFADGSAAALSAAGTGSLIYNNTTHTFQASLNGGAYATLGGGGGVTWPLQNSTSTNTFNYGGTMTGSSTAHSFRSTNADTVGDKLISVGGTAEEVYLSQTFSGAYEWRSVGAAIGLRNSTGDGIIAQSANNVYIYGNNAAQVLFFANNYMAPQVATLTLGAAASPWATTYSKHYSGAGTAPTKAAGACIGGTQTVTLDANASDSVGNITLTGTATGTVSATCATVTFNTAYATAPHCTINPANAAAAALSGAASLYVDSASTTTALFIIKVGATALVAGTYIYTYDCEQ